MWRDQAWLFDILSSARKALRYIQELSQDEFLGSTLHQDAVFRQLEVIGEATKRLSIQVREQNPSIPWRRMARLRDTLIHEYDRIDVELVWRIVQEELPPLVDKIAKLLPPLSSTG